jgi:hypothetical protein
MWRFLRIGRRSHSIPPDLWDEALRSLPVCSYLSPADQSRLRELVVRFLRAKHFESAAGLAITDRMRIQVALQACLLILNLDLDYYAGWHAVILYPGDFRVPREAMDEAGVVHQWTDELAGESWERGPVILSWDATANPEPGINIVLHEFAHKLDMRDGVADGCPPLPAHIDPAGWARDFQSAYRHLCAALDRGEPVRVDDYAAESPAEFFAVMSELFFLDPELLTQEFPAIYRLLRDFYRQDPLRVLKPQ